MITQEEAQKLIVESPEHAAAQQKCEALLKKIAALPDVAPAEFKRFNRNAVRMRQYLGEIPEQVHEIIEQAFRINVRDQSLTKHQILINIFAMLDELNLRLSNPFMLYYRHIDNYNELITGKFRTGIAGKSNLFIPENKA